jgi:hypothetical protein
VPKRRFAAGMLLSWHGIFPVRPPDRRFQLQFSMSSTLSGPRKPSRGSGRASSTAFPIPSKHQMEAICWMVRAVRALRTRQTGYAYSVCPPARILPGI